MTQSRHFSRSAHFLVAMAFCAALQATAGARAGDVVRPCQIEVVEKGSRWPVPMVELETTNSVKFVTDNAGRVAFDLTEFMGGETWLSVSSDGYEVSADGFGKRGMRFTPKPGETFTIEVNRTSVAKRIGRLTGAGLFGESQKLGLEKDWKESGIVGCDSIQNAIHSGRMYWFWGDTIPQRYPLGVYDSTGATTDIRPLKSFEPPLRPSFFDFIADASGRPRGVAKMPGSGPTWLVGTVTLPDKTGKERLVATYIKSKPPMEVYETGLCAWNDETSNFEFVRKLWTKTDASPKHPLMPTMHAVIIDGDDGQKWAVFGNPLPTLKCRATFEAWQDPAQWQKLEPQHELISASDGKPIEPNAGSIAWSPYRKRWVTVFLQTFGAPSGFGEVWYAEADSPFGPWGRAVKILSHANYSFYNPRVHPEFTADDSPVLLFEGTHSQTFANHPTPTPRYDYNQILYRVDLDDAKLDGAHGDNTSAVGNTGR